MLSKGLYRVTAAESLSMSLHMGLKATVATGSTGTTLVLDVDETDPIFSNTATGFQLPAGTKILIGEQGLFNNNSQVVTLSSRAEYGRAVGKLTISGTATNGKIVTLISADGTSKAYTAAASEDLTADPCKFKSGGNKQLVAESLVNCILDASGGHNGKIIPELDLTGTDPVIRLIQKVPGTDGNTTISENEANIAITQQFSNGAAGQITATINETLAHPVGTEATILFVPAASFDGDDGTILLDKRTFGILESPDSRKIIYDVTWGISMHPKYIGADGDSTNTGIAGIDNNDATSQSQHIHSSGGNTDVIDNNGSAHRLDGDGTHQDTTADTYDMVSIGLSPHGGNGYGYGFGARYAGMTSPKIRVFQPRGKARFTADQMGGSDNANKAGWITAEETSITSPNPAYRIVTGSGGNDNTLPHFQLMQDIDEDLRDPRILIVGYKYLFEEVSDSEVREMIRRSGRFNYKIVQDPGQMSAFGDGVSGPSEGWKATVEGQRGRRMSFEDYKRATESVTDQTMNQLYGTRPSEGTRRTSDPRQRHRRY